MSIRTRIERDPYNRIVFKKFPRVVLVGGYLRELLRGRESKDRDYLLFRQTEKDPLHKAAMVVQAEIGGRIVSLKEGTTVRLIPKKGESLDFTLAEGSLEEDLYRRDFTINSIGYNPSKGIIDLTGGLEDLERGIIRAVKEENIVKDPVRIVRGYRFLSELQGSFDEETRIWLVRNRELLAETAPERITTEFIRLFRGKGFLRVLSEAADDGILSVIFSCKNNELESLINKLHKIYRKIKVTPSGLKKMENLSEYEIDILGEGLDLFKILCLELLLMNTFKGIGEGRQVIIVPAKLKGRIRGLMRVMDRGVLPAGPEERFDIYREAWPAVLEYILYQERADLFSEAEFFLKLIQKPPISGTRIKELRPDLAEVKIGELIKAVQKEVFGGRLKGEDEFERFVSEYKI